MVLSLLCALWALHVTVVISARHNQSCNGLCAALMSSNSCQARTIIARARTLIERGRFRARHERREE